MKELIVAALIGVPATVVANVASAPLQNWWSSLSRPEIGAELHVSVPRHYPAISGLVVTRTATGTNVDLFR
jgi:hypothetical protein